jgi:hypothetical protein
MCNQLTEPKLRPLVIWMKSGISRSEVNSTLDSSSAVSG